MTSMIDYISNCEQDDQPIEQFHKEKWFGTFCFPYMNGPLHIGHLFTFSKVEIAGRYQKLKGKDVLIPMGFHCTGTPIYAMAQRLCHESKTIISTLKASDVAEVDIPKFKDPQHWIDYFPQKGKADLSLFKSQVDWSRSFHTTEVNLYFDSFVRWQFCKLRDLGLLEHGVRNSIYCLEDNQICSDHDRILGEECIPLTTMLRCFKINDDTYIAYLDNETNTNTTLSSISLQIDPTQEWVETEMPCGRCYIVKNLLQCYDSDQKYNHILLSETQSGRLEYVEKEKEKADWSWFNKLSGVKAITNNGSPLHGNGEVFSYIISVPSGLVVSRTGHKCIVKKTEQWYIKYGEPEWKDRVKKYITDKLETYNSSTKEQLLIAVDWLKEWGFSRSCESGLGTKIPWDEKYFIDSLSDSTIYMAYYTIAHILHKDISGKVPNLINACDCNNEFWNSVFYQEVGIPAFEGCKVSPVVLDMCRQQFRYWYPVDLRVSANDLIPNHLIMSLYTHIAIFGEEYTPKSFYCNGYITVNGEKMSKSHGNFITAKEAILKYGNSVLKICLADAGSSNCIKDANFNAKNAESITKHLYTLIKWYETKRMTKVCGIAEDELSLISMFKVDIDIFFYHKLMNYYKLAIDAYESMKYKDALTIVFYNLTNCREHYEKTATIVSPFLIKIYTYIQTCLLYPIIPNIAVYLTDRGFIEQLAEIEKILLVEPINYNIVKACDIFDNIISKIRSEMHRLAKKSKNPATGNVRISQGNIEIFERFKLYLEEQTKIALTFEPHEGYTPSQFSVKLGDPWGPYARHVVPPLP